ncbi:hypothetical protein LCGC14_1079180 [marine sediment metagenome]|uniref:DUF6874 domain-containing protein n=1 Tax=marine sediment metagenome TaxID=412755 RepID=A0A0F9N3D4_9ZZZZ
MINWEATKGEHDTIIKIAKRAVKLAQGQGVDYPTMDATMDVAAIHLNGCPLKLNELLEADDVNFAHDVFGIRRHIDRNTGELQNCFIPRYAQ